MSKIDLTKEYSHRQYMNELNKLGVKHIKDEEPPHKFYFCGWCKHANLGKGGGQLGSWLLQSHCSKRDMTPVSEFCWCNEFGIEMNDEYWLDYPKESQELFCIITSREFAKTGGTSKEVIEKIGVLAEAIRSERDDK